MTDLDLAAIEQQARAAEARGEGVTRRTLKGLEVNELEDEASEEDAAAGIVEKTLSAEQ